MELSAPQHEAVRYIGSPTLVVAGAGSGKTRTLTAKVAHLVGTGYDPERILAITFTNKAAEEMKRRLRVLTGLGMDRFPWVRTYHSACFRILKEHCDLLGFRKPLQIYATYQQGKLIKEVAARLDIDKKHVPALTAQISNAKNSGDPEGFLDRRPGFFRVRLMDAYRHYEKELRSRNAVDFDNILLLTRDLLRDHPDLRGRFQDHFQFILCDEYQDTNDLNEEITGLLLRDGNLFAVGDDWQSIYSFRMSNVDHFISFTRKYENARIFRLERNYRSADEIVQAANVLIDHNDRKVDKRCFSEKRGGMVEVHRFPDDRREADWVARKIRVLLETGVPYHRMAVLYRTKFTSLAFERALRLHGIPYQMLGGRGFFERKEILDLNCYITSAAFGRDDAAFERILNTPKRGIGPGTIRKIAGLKTGDMSLKDAARKALVRKILTPKLYGAISHLMTLLDDIRDLPPGEAIAEVIERTDYMAHLRSYAKADTMDFTSREENIEQLLHAASQHRTLIDYLEEAALVREDREEEEEGQSGAVNLSTVHAAKGLEFEAVFVVACEENIFPHWRSMETETALEEERRLMYVSMTRSERYLYLSSAIERRDQRNPRSRFLDEIETVL